VWHNALYAFWFFWPAGMANMTPILVSKVPLLRDWKTPLDFGHTYHGTQLFGANKTWRGLICGVIVAQIIFLFMRYLGHDLGDFTGYMALHGYFRLPWYLGSVMAVGVILGDAIESFFKRRRNIPPGSSWYPFDQIDYIIGACLFALPIVILPFSVYLLIFLGGFVFHLFFSYLGYLLHFKRAPI
jgi:CDP-2,3-bis-(O-geranylgeranyl)-sn-glycerol synthase